MRHAERVHNLSPAIGHDAKARHLMTVVPAPNFREIRDIHGPGLGLKRGAP
jgi:hypothetical protein